MNFTEVIRKSNLAKQEVLKTRTTAEDIKTALVEQGVDIADVKFDDIAQFIKENNISAAASSWKRPEEWLTLSKVVTEEPKYTNKAEETQQDYSNTDYVTYLNDIGGNLSEVTTGMKDGVFNVSANDFAYEMLCKIEENSDNLLLFEGVVLRGIFNAMFTQLSTQDGANFLTDLFIQIDNEEPLNLTQLARGEINLPTEGKYKNISIINEETLFAPSNNTYIGGNIRDDYSPISLLVSLDYNSFDEETKMKNGDKQCIIRIWGNGFIRLTPYRSYYNKNTILNCYSGPAIIKANTCILDINVCDSNIEVPFEDSSVEFYLPLTLECLLLGFGEFTQKISLISSLSPSYFKNRFTSQFLEGINYVFNKDYFAMGPGTYAGFTIYSFNDSNFYMNLKEIDCSNVKYYNDYKNMMYFLFATPTRQNDMVYSMLGKVKNIENIVFPNFKENISDNECYLMYPFLDSNINEVVCTLSIMPYCFDLNAFKCLKRDSIVDLINKLPTIDLEINSENLLSLRDIYNTIGVQQLTINNSVKNNIVTIQDDISTSKSLSDMIEDIIKPSMCADCFNGNKELVKKYVSRFAGVDTDVHKTLFIRPKLDYIQQVGEDLSEACIDKKMFHSIIVSSLTFKELTEDDIKLAEDKGWRIVTDINYPTNMFRTIGYNYNQE